MDIEYILISKLKDGKYFSVGVFMDNYSTKDIFNTLTENQILLREQYYKDNPESPSLKFDNELRSLGFEFQTSKQLLKIVPKYKDVILPIAIKYYNLAKQLNMSNEQNSFIEFFRFKGFDDVVPMLLKDYHSDKTTDLTRWFISDCLYQIRSGKFINEYIDIVTDNKFGINRQMIILLLGKLKAESAVPVLIGLLEDEEVRLHAICTLGDFKREDFRCCFERFQNSNNYVWRKYSQKAINKLDKAK